MGKLSKLAKVKESKDKAAKLLLLKTKKGKKRKNPTGGRPPKVFEYYRINPDLINAVVVIDSLY